MFWLCYGEYRGRRALTPFLRYFQARLRAEIECLTYRAYITDSLFLQAQNKAPGQRWVEMLEGLDRPVDRRSGEEIAVDFIRRAGLKFEGG